MIGRRSIALRRSSLLLTALFMCADLLPTGGLPAQRVEPDRGRVDFTLRTKPRPRMRAVSGGLVYEEHLYKGGLRTRYWSPTGLIKPDAFLERDVAQVAAGDELPLLDEPIACSFGLSVDGQELWDHWSWKSSQELPCEAEHDSQSGREDHRRCRHMAVDLVNEIRPIRVRVHTQVDGNPFLKRWLEITNNGQSAAAIGALYPMSGFLFAGRRLKENLPSEGAGIFSVLRTANFDPWREGDFRWVTLPDGSYSYGNSKWGMPYSVVRNAVTGESFAIYFGWTGRYSFEFFNNHNPASDDASLYFRAGLAGPGPFRVLGPGETATSPPVFIGHFLDDLDGIVLASHKFLRESVLPALPKGRVRPVEMNSWGFVAFELSEESLRSAIDTAADVGVELFTIDAGWYGDVKSNWWQMAGDWKTGSRLPDGLEPIFDYARSKGLMCGLWIDIERIGTASELRKKHPDWIVRVHGASEGQTALDFTNPEVVKFAEETLAGLIERYKLDVFRLDYNTDIGLSGAQNRREGFVENSYWRHYDAIYAMYRQLRKRFPNLMMENCAGGGGRNDLGMLQNFHWAQVSDEWGGVRTLKALNGFSLALPPEYGLSYVGFMNDENYRYGDVDFRFRGQMFGHLCLGGVAPNAAEFPAAHRDKVRHNVNLYKTFIRPVLPTVKVYHHTPVLPNTEPGEWCVLEHVTPDQSRGYAGVFRLAGAREESYLFRPRGLDVSATYKVTFDNTGKSVQMRGEELGRSGLLIRLGEVLRSELVLFERQ